jgi:hypothetical protein
MKADETPPLGPIQSRLTVPGKLHECNNERNVKDRVRAPKVLNGCQLN